MPAHDWKRVSPGTFHDFHCTWIPEIKTRLNTGLLPADFYAQVEQVAGDTITDVLTLRPENGRSKESGDSGGGIALAPPKVRITAKLEIDVYAAMARRLTIRHASGDQIVAMIDVVSPGNKSSQREFRRFVEKAATTLIHGCHLLLIDLLPPTSRDPQGVDGALWAELGDESYVAPADKPLTLAAYTAGITKTAYVEPFAVGDVLNSMPLFLTETDYVTVPLEETYQAAYRSVPRRWREMLEAAAESV